MVLDYEAAARITHLICNRNEARALLELALFERPDPSGRVEAALLLLKDEPEPGVPGGPHREQLFPVSKAALRQLDRAATLPVENCPSYDICQRRRIRLKSLEDQERQRELARGQGQGTTPLILVQAKTPVEEYGLTPRQYDVAKLLIEGLTNKEIAVRLALSLQTIRTHVAAVYAKTGVHRRAALSQAIDLPTAFT